MGSFNCGHFDPDPKITLVYRTAVIPEGTPVSPESYILGEKKSPQHVSNQYPSFQLSTNKIVSLASLAKKQIFPDSQLG